MMKIFKFFCLNNTQAITVEETQTSFNQVKIIIHNNDELIELVFQKDEFFEFMGMRYRLDFNEENIELPAQKELMLVA